MTYGTNNALLSVGRRTDCLSHRKICTLFETCPWKLVPQLTCFVPPKILSSMEEKYTSRAIGEKGFTKKASRGWVRGCVDFETPGRLGLATS